MSTDHLKQRLLETDRTHDSYTEPITKYKPLVASSVMLVAVAFFASNLLLIKILAMIDPNVSHFLLITLRSLSGLCLLTPIGTLQTKNTLVSMLTDPFKQFSPWTFSIAFGAIIYEIMICYVCVRVLPIVIVSIFINMAPLFTVLLAVPILGEKLDVFNIV